MGIATWWDNEGGRLHGWVHRARAHFVLLVLPGQRERAAEAIKHKNSLHEICTLINSSRAACKEASRLSSMNLVWVQMMDLVLHLSPHSLSQWPPLAVLRKNSHMCTVHIVLCAKFSILLQSENRVESKCGTNKILTTFCFFLRLSVVANNHCTAIHKKV